MNMKEKEEELKKADKECFEKKLETTVEDVLYTDSDAGSVLIGNDDFTIAVPNGYGDGRHPVVICKSSKKLARFNYHGFVEGKFNVYNYDCGGEFGGKVVKTLDGRFGIYYLSGIVVFEKWEEKA